MIKTTNDNQNKFNNDMNKKDYKNNKYKRNNIKNKENDDIFERKVDIETIYNIKKKKLESWIN